MGHQNQGSAYGLVSMTNKDAYYMDEATYRKFTDLLLKQSDGYITFYDAKSGQTVTISVKQISSLIALEGGRNA